MAKGNVVNIAGGKMGFQELRPHRLREAPQGRIGKIGIEIKAAD